MDSEVISNHLANMRLLISDHSKRCNFDKELKDLNSILTWYKDTIDFTFHSPVTKTHFKQGRIKEVSARKKVMSPEQAMKFINHLTDPFRSMALIQLYLAARIGEVAALNTDTVDFERRHISISETIVWIKGKPSHSFRTKTGQSSVIEMNEEMFTLLRALDSKRPPGCKYFFHQKGKPLRHAMILKRFNEALEAAGLKDYSGTHILRHTMATLSRKLSGLDATQALLRHTTARMTEGYAKLDVNEKVSKVVIDAAEIFNKARQPKELLETRDQTRPRLKNKF